MNGSPRLFPANDAALRRYAQQARADLSIRLGLAVLSVSAFSLLAFGLWRLGFSLGALVGGFHRMAVVLGLMLPPWPDHLGWTCLRGLTETLAIAYLGTLVAAFLAFPIGLLAARNVVANRIVHFLARRCLDTVRGVDTLIWALLFINVVGLGPFAGILAIAASDMGSFGKLFSEAIEAADSKPVDGVLAAGGSTLHGVRYGILPQVLPIMASQVLYYFESNTRSATIIGVVGAGGIGLYLSNEIAQANWGRVAFIILMILVTVFAIDFVSTRLRRGLIGRPAS